MLLVSELAKLFGPNKDKAVGLRPLNFTLKEGTFFTLLGPSGCGKTTTLRCIAGLEKPDSGAIRLGEDVLFDGARQINVPLNRRGLGMVFQSYAIWPHMSIFDNVAFPLRATKGRARGQAEIASMVNEALERVDLGGFGARSPTQLSGGQQQRVALARAIVHRPKLLLLDEPLSNLDARLRDEMRAELKRLQREIGITTVYVTHDQSEALEMSDLIAVLNKGRLCQLGSAREVFFEPADGFVANFMGSPNLLPGKTVKDVREGEIGEVKLADGRSIICRFPRQLAANAPAVVSMRPEIMSLTSPTKVARDGWNSFSGRIVTIDFQGYLSRCTVDIGNMTLQANVDSREGWSVGADVLLGFPYHEAIGLAQASKSG